MPPRRYFGIAPKTGAVTCGVVFPISWDDMLPFMLSEGGNITYWFQEVTDKVDIKIKDAIVLTCIPKHPGDIGRVPERYIKLVDECVQMRSKRFQKAFGKVEDYL